MKSKVAIVSVLYRCNREEFRNFINSLRLIKGNNFRLVLVNNDTRISWTMSETKTMSGVKIINLGKNLGFCAGSNLGINYSIENGFDKVLLLNNDTTVESSIIDDLSAYVDQNPKVGIVSPIIMSMKKKNIIFYAGGICNQFFGFTRNRFMGKRMRDQKIKSEKTQAASGCCMLIKKDVFEKIGFLDDDYFMYFDDPDFSLRAQKAGFEVHLLAKPLVYHVNSSNRLNENAAYYYGRNPFILIRKNFPWYLKPTAYLGQFMVRLPRNIFRLKNARAIKQYLKGMYKGTEGK